MSIHGGPESGTKKWKEGAKAKDARQALEFSRFSKERNHNAIELDKEMVWETQPSRGTKRGGGWQAIGRAHGRGGGAVRTPRPTNGKLRH